MKANKRIAYILFVIYIVFICWVVLFKMATSIEDIPHLRGINLVPFKYIGNADWLLLEAIYNVLAFIPAGFFFSLFLSNRSKSALGIVAVFLFSLIIEIIQWVFQIGASDVTDLICNTLGGVIGWIVFIIVRRLLWQK